MIGRRIPQEIFKRSPSQALSGIKIHVAPTLCFQLAANKLQPYLDSTHAMGDWNAAFAHQNCTKKQTNCPGSVPLLGPDFGSHFGHQMLTPPKTGPQNRNPKRGKKAPTGASNFRAVYSGLFLTARESNMPLTWHLP